MTAHQRKQALRRTARKLAGLLPFLQHLNRLEQFRANVALDVTRQKLCVSLHGPAALSIVFTPRWFGVVAANIVRATLGQLA